MGTQIIKLKAFIAYKYCFSLFFIALLSSCATILNSPNQKINIRTKKPSTVVYRGIPLEPKNTDSTFFQTQVMRSAQEIKLDVIVDTNEAVIKLYPRNSIAFWGNLSLYGIGMLIDMENNKRYSYPKTTYVNFNESEIYSHYKPLSNDYLNKKNRIKLDPFSVFNANFPGIKVTYERFFRYPFSIQSNITFITNPLSINNKKHSGFGLGIEGRYYTSLKKPSRFYFAFEMGYLQTFKNDELAFYKNDTILRYEYLDLNVFHQEFYIIPKLGVQFVLSETIVLDIFTGLGIKQKYFTYHNISKDKINYIGDREDSLFFIDNSEGNRTAVKFTFGVNLGFAF